jgi:hypothetical protein
MYKFKHGVVDWSPPSARGDALFGAGATRAEVALAVGAGTVGALVVMMWAVIDGSGWAGWQVALAAVIALDVVGGVVANGVNAAKRDHFGPPSATSRSFGGFVVRRPVLFAAMHLHAIVVALVFAPALWWWGVLWWGAVLACVIAVRTSPLYLERPVALAALSGGVLLAAILPAPAYWGWLPVMMMLKLVLAHAVQEEPYRPSVDVSGDPPKGR